MPPRKTGKTITGKTITGKTRRASTATVSSDAKAEADCKKQGGVWIPATATEAARRQNQLDVLEQ
jgi:hypothetical protein